MFAARSYYDGSDVANIGPRDATLVEAKRRLLHDHIQQQKYLYKGVDANGNRIPFITVAGGAAGSPPFGRWAMSPSGRAYSQGMFRQRWALPDASAFLADCLWDAYTQLAGAGETKMILERVVERLAIDERATKVANGFKKKKRKESKLHFDKTPVTSVPPAPKRSVVKKKSVATSAMAVKGTPTQQQAPPPLAARKVTTTTTTATIKARVPTPGPQVTLLKARPPTPGTPLSARGHAVKQHPSRRITSGSKIGRMKYGKPHQNPLKSVRPTSGSASNIPWPEATSFSPDTGRHKIVEFIEKTWKYDDRLRYSVEHMFTARLSSARRYKYRVCWVSPSTNTKTPTPSSADSDSTIGKGSSFTGCVYFNIDVPAAGRETKRVDVCYTFQANKRLHKPGRSRYHEQWLSELADGRILSDMAMSAS